MAFVEAYSNEQLQKALREYGINVPITPTSRKVCENKLKKLMGATNPQTDVRDDGDKPDDKEPTPKAIDEPINFVYHRSVASAAERHNASELADQSDSDPGETSARNLSRQERKLYEKHVQKPGDSSTWKYIGLVFLLVVFISFLVFLNRNAQRIEDDI